MIEEFEDILNERMLDLHISEKANECFKELIGKLSYLQILTLCKRVAVFLSDKVVTGSMSRKFAQNAALLNVSKFYERSVLSGWDIAYTKLNEIHPERRCLSAELSFFLDKVLNKPLTFLKEVPSIENISEPNC